MNINKLRIFHEVFVTGSITRAAERSYVSQPAASKMLSNFEAEIGYKLFSRSNGKLIPTDQAQYLHEEVYSLLQSVNHLEDSIKGAKGNKAGRLRIASILGPSYRFLPRIIAQYKRRYPNVQVSLHLPGSAATRQGVATGQYQIGLVDKAESSSRHDSVAMDLRCYCAIPKDHPAAAQKILTPDILKDTDWVTLDFENATTKALKSVYEQKQLTFSRSMEVNTTIQALSCVDLGMGATLVDAINNAHFSDVFNLPNVIVLPFEPMIYEPLEIITSNVRPLSDIAQEFYDLMIDKLDETLNNN